MHRCTSSSEADAILWFIAFSALWGQSQPVEFHQELVNDPGDIPFAEVAICSHAEVLVTGNMRHFGFLRNTSIKGLLPEEFLTQYADIV
jgi:predicted nucleic acid-binding protein